MIQDRFVTGSGALRRDLPGKALHHALSSGRAETFAQRRIVEEPSDRLDERLGVIGLDEQTRFATGADHFGQRSPGRRHNRHGATHGLNRG